MKRGEMLRVAVLQYDPRFGETNANLDHVESMIGHLACDLLVLPELFASGYWFSSREEVESVAEDVKGATMERVRGWARELDCAIVGGWPERSGDTIYNSALLVSPESDLVHYRKLHLFAEEKRWFAPGDLPLAVTEFRGTRIGVMICFDWRFPETARSLAFLGADLIAHPANLVLPWCPDAMITRALENNVFIATSDRSGDDVHGEDRLHFIGQSQVVAPDGDRLARLPESGEGILEVRIDPAKARRKAVNAWNDLFGDLRPEFYTGPEAAGI
jgi:predicted amidohydrolase